MREEGQALPLLPQVTVQKICSAKLSLSFSVLSSLAAPEAECCQRQDTKIEHILDPYSHLRPDTDTMNFPVLALMQR